MRMSMGYRRTHNGLAVISVALLVSGCGTEAAGDGDPGPASLSSEAAEVERVASETEAQLYGNAEQREAKHWLTFRELNRAYEECIQSQGVAWVAEFATLYAGFVPDGTAGTWMGALNRKPSDNSLTNAEAAYFDAPGQLTPLEQTPEFEAAAAACDSVGNQNLNYEVYDPGEGLAGDFIVMLDGVEAQLGRIAPYTACMSDAGIEFSAAAEGEEGYQGLYLYLTGEMPRPPLPGGQPDQAWLDYLELEERALAADAECRGAQYEQGLLLLGPKLEEYVDRYAAELRTSRDSWEAYLTQAEVAGYSP